MAAHALHDKEGSMSSSSSSSSVNSNPERPDSPTTLFEDSLFTLFSHNQPAHGDPGDLCKYTHVNLPSRYQPASSSCKTTIRYKIAQNSGTNTKLFAHHQWDAGLYLADLIAEHSSEVVLGKQNCERFANVRGKYVVELGAGTGLPGLIASVMGADKTVITDYPDPYVIDNLESNLDLALQPRKQSKVERNFNPHYLQAREKVQVMGLGWGNAEEEAKVLAASSTQGGEEGYDLVLAADVLWVSSAHPLLIHSIRKLLKRNRNARCVLIAGFHTGRPAVRRFFVQLAQASSEDKHTLEDEIRAGVVPDWEEEKFGGIWERNIDGTQRAWFGGSVPIKADHHTRLAGKVNWAKEEVEEEMGDISDRGSWVVVASLRWADLD
ncbi:related to NNT1 - putative nicotinamide N-methyltransferase [Melanopsichium pennsylvanicum]|uniref:Uncharacterized protein n=2 Tax=Melanopsichium pennsylvanicum TaxID=63383 RepID=A0A077R6A1_9BASI|nr:conserved hypothetical protein [Melanopsichium pennsylvanicum 4]SNX83119.1 related to NNT1 - putative nicotinamide N-methyltransferase [Melanopsichium pennsylvanicum]